MNTKRKKSDLTLSILDQSPVHKDEDSVQSLQRTIELATKADDWVYHRYWVAEHHNTTVTTQAPASLQVARSVQGLLPLQGVPAST